MGRIRGPQDLEKKKNDLKDQSSEQEIPKQSETVKFLNKYVLGPKTQIKPDVEDLAEFTEKNYLAASGVSDGKAKNTISNNPLNETGDPADKPVAAYKEVSGSGQGKRHKTYTADGILVSEGRGSGPVNLPERSDTDAKFEDEKQPTTTNAPNIGLGYAEQNTFAEGMEEGAETQYQGAVYKDFYKKNILHDYDTVTYNFTLSMLSERDAVLAQTWILEGNKDGQGFKDWSAENKKVIIAETGSTVLSINDVQINVVAGPINNGKRLTGATDFQMTIQQPLNASFTDTLVNAAVSLGLPDGLKASYLLELKFRGRDPDTGRIVPIPKTDRQFLIEIISVEASVDTNGASYSVRAARAGDKALR